MKLLLIGLILLLTGCANSLNIYFDDTDEFCIELPNEDLETEKVNTTVRY